IVRFLFSNFCLARSCFRHLTLGSALRQRIGRSRFDYKSGRLVRGSLFQAGGKCLLAGIVRFRIDQGGREPIVRPDRILGFKSWLHARFHELSHGAGPPYDTTAEQRQMRQNLHWSAGKKPEPEPSAEALRTLPLGWRRANVTLPQRGWSHQGLRPLAMTSRTRF